MSDKGSNLVAELGNVSSEDMINMLMGDKPAESIPPANPPATPDPTKPEVIVPEVIVPDPANPVAPKAPIITTPDPNKDKPVDPPANPDSAKTADTNIEFSLESTAPPAEDNGWKDVAKEWEIELETDTIEAFKEKLDDHYKSKYEINLGKYNPETQAIIEFVEAGGDIKQLHEPLKEFHDLKALGDAEIVYKDLLDPEQ